MTFLNEKIPASDFDRYNIASVNKQFFCSPEEHLYWTIDRERNIYLRWMGDSREEPYEDHICFYWKGALFRFELTRIGGGERNGPCYTRWSWNGMWEPKTLEDREIWKQNKAEILDDLRDALRTYKDLGALSNLAEADHSAYFDF